MVFPYSLVHGKTYSVNTDIGLGKGTNKGTFSRYEQNKIIGKDEPIWSIVFMEWWGESNRENLHSEEKPCQIQIYLDPIDNLSFHAI